MFQVSPEAESASRSFSKAQKERSNIVLDQTEIADQYSIIGFESEEKPSERVTLSDDKDRDSITLVQPEKVEAQTDMSMPKWATYDNPVAQKSLILLELEEVKKNKLNFEMAEQEDLKHQLPLTEGSDLVKKQSGIDASHKLQVDKIKSEIYADRQAFLEKLMQLASDSAKQSHSQLCAGGDCDKADKFGSDSKKGGLSSDALGADSGQGGQSSDSFGRGADKFDTGKG